jgi:hypothetical protein
LVWKETIWQPCTSPPTPTSPPLYPFSRKKLTPEEFFIHSHHVFKPFTFSGKKLEILRRVTQTTFKTFGLKGNIFFSLAGWRVSNSEFFSIFGKCR